MLKKCFAAAAMFAALTTAVSVKAQYNPTGSVTNQQPNSLSMQRDSALRDSTLAGGTGTSLIPSTTTTPIPDVCIKFPNLKACQPPSTGGGGAAEPTPQYALVGRCGLMINSPSGTTLPQLGSGFGDGFCNSEKLVWNGTTSGSLNLLFEVGDTATDQGNGFYATWGKTKASDWKYEWTGRCSGVVTYRCYPTYGSVGIGTRINEEMTVTVTHVATGEKHVVKYSMNLYLCGAIVKNQRYGCA